MGRRERGESVRMLLRAGGWEGNSKDWLGLLHHFNKGLPCLDPKEGVGMAEEKGHNCAMGLFPIKRNPFRLSQDTLKEGGLGKQPVEMCNRMH